MISSLFVPILAQAAAVPSTNSAPASAVSAATHGLAARFEEATGLPGEVAMWALNVLIAVGILALGYIVARIVRNAIAQILTRRHIEATVATFVGNIVHALVMAFVVITALEKLGIDTKTFAAVVAAAGLAIGLALQGSLSNFAAGFLIVLFRPFKKDDQVVAAGVEGVVEEVQIFSTTLHTADNKKIIVPNSSIMGSIITNYTANPIRRVDLGMGVGPSSQLSKAHEILLSLAKADGSVLKDPPSEVVNLKLIDGGTQIELHAWCKTQDYGALMSRLVSQAPDAFAAEGIKGPDKSVVFVERK